jgi:hypothetical protein
MVIRPATAIGDFRNGLGRAKYAVTSHADGGRKTRIRQRRIDEGLFGTFDLQQVLRHHRGV